MNTGQKAVVWFDEVTRKDIPLVVGKGANLGEMTNAGISGNTTDAGLKGIERDVVARKPQLVSPVVSLVGWRSVGGRTVLRTEVCDRVPGSVTMRRVANR